MVKGRSLHVVVVLGLAAALAVAGAAQVQAEVIPGQYLVSFSGNRVPGNFAARVEGLGGTVAFAHRSGFAVVQGLTKQAAAKLARVKGVGEVQLDETFQLEPGLTGEVEGVPGIVTESPTIPTAAYFYARQWHMRAVGADVAWANDKIGSPGVTLAIIDSGIDYQYYDLSGRVDLSRSVSFVPSDDALVDTYFPGRHYVTDLFFHGTHVASTAVSKSYVVAGVSTMTTLMGVKVCSVQGSCAFSAVISGVLHAADNGADVANLSLGGGFYKAGDGRYVGYINKVFNYAWSAGMLIVVSAGNEAIDLDHDGNLYKTYCSTPNTVCVSATGPTSSGGTNGPWTNVDAPASYTNFGRSAISVAAPGGTNAGPVWGACSGTSLIIPVCQTGTYVLGATGTSMAAPHVAGLAALLVAEVGKDPSLVREIIQDSADDLGQDGTDPFYGKGRINVGTALGY